MKRMDPISSPPTCSGGIRPPAFFAGFALELVEKVLVWPAEDADPTALDAIALYFLRSVAAAAAAAEMASGRPLSPDQVVDIDLSPNGRGRGRGRVVGGCWCAVISGTAIGLRWSPERASE